jgi:hypothetical protein
LDLVLLLKFVIEFVFTSFAVELFYLLQLFIEFNDNKLVLEF